MFADPMLRTALALAVFTLPVAAQEPATSGFLLTYGLENRAHGTIWNGGVEENQRVRSLDGWHFHEDDRIAGPNRWEVRLQNVANDIAISGVVLDLVGPESRPVAVYSRLGDIDFTPEEIPYGRLFRPAGFGGNIGVERVPIPVTVSSHDYEDDSPALLRTKDGEYWLAWIGYQTRKRDGYYYDGADQVMYARSRDGRLWSRPEPLTPPGDHFRVALGQDADGAPIAVYSLQKTLGSGNFDLYSRRFYDGAWGPERRLTSDSRPDIFHRIAGGGDGAFTLVWMGFRDNPNGGAPQSDILAKRFDGRAWGPEINLTMSPEDDWAPSVAMEAGGRAWVAWDAYRGDNGYDLLLKSLDGNRAGETVAVSAAPYAEMSADVAVDGQGRVWIAWEEAAANWGKDTGYQNPKLDIFLKEGNRLYGSSAGGIGRRARVAVYAGGALSQPQAELEDAYPSHLDAKLFQAPRLVADESGRVWLLLRHQWRAFGRWGGHLFDSYAMTIAGGKWTPPILLPGSTGRQDATIAAIASGDERLTVAVVGDNRRLPVTLPKHHDVRVLTLDGALMDGDASPPLLTSFAPTPSQSFTPTHANEAADLARIRGHRLEVGGQSWKIVRGDLHRHTEVSMDGAIDGTLFDVYRYAINAAELDFLGVSDHNYGQWLDTDEPSDSQSDSEFQWWRTQKLADVFYVPGRFTPLYGYERTPNFPLGHRNIFHAKRGVFSLKVPKLHVRESPETLDSDPQNLWNYLRRTGGIGIPHTTATVMGTDWSRRDDEVIPVVEIYQGDRNSYETQGGPRSALPGENGPGGAGRKPFQKGLVWNALGAGYRMGFTASSDHYSTHISYANLIVPDAVTTREDLMDAFRSRRTFASTDNIVIDFHSGAAQQGAEIQAASAPELAVNVEGTAPIRTVEIIKNNRVVYTKRGEGDSSVAFRYRDEAFADTSMGETALIKDWSRPETGVRARPAQNESYYYVRVVQSFSAQEPEKAGEVAWSSPIYVVHDSEPRP